MMCDGCVLVLSCRLNSHVWLHAHRLQKRKLEMEERARSNSD